jgi:antitoxin HigA-1
MISIASVLFGLMPVQKTLKLLITIRPMVRVPADRPPTHPGEMLREEFLVPLNLSQQALAIAINVPYQRLNEIVRKRRGVTPSTALRLAKVLGTSPQFWLNLQLRWDLYHALQHEQAALAHLKPLS